MGSLFASANAIRDACSTEAVAAQLNAGNRGMSAWIAPTHCPWPTVYFQQRFNSSPRTLISTWKFRGMDTTKPCVKKTPTRSLLPVSDFDGRLRALRCRFIFRPFRPRSLQSSNEGVRKDGSWSRSPLQPWRCIRDSQDGGPGKPRYEAGLHFPYRTANGTLRQWRERLTRLIYAFSKKWDNLKAALALHFARCNFCRIHGKLRVTPDREAGITDHVWAIGELICL